jgi:Family of unknown function (DUF5317)
MIIPLAALVVLLLPLLFGGSASRLAMVKLQHIEWIAAALLIQILIVELLTGPELLLKAAHILTYVVALWFMIVNRRIPGLWLIGLGAISNGVTIAVNGGTLPARLGALRSAGINLSPDRFVNSGEVAHPHLSLLGDIFAIPAALPLSNVFSIGDILIILGTAVAAWRILGTRWTKPWTPAFIDHDPGYQSCTVPSVSRLTGR